MMKSATDATVGDSGLMPLAADAPAAVASYILAGGWCRATQVIGDHMRTLLAFRAFLPSLAFGRRTISFSAARRPSMFVALSVAFAVTATIQICAPVACSRCRISRRAAAHFRGAGRLEEPMGERQHEEEEHDHHVRCPHPAGGRPTP